MQELIKVELCPTGPAGDREASARLDRCGAYFRRCRLLDGRPSPPSSDRRYSSSGPKVQLAGMKFRRPRSRALLASAAASAGFVLLASFLVMPAAEGDTVPTPPQATPIDVRPATAGPYWLADWEGSEGIGDSSDWSFIQAEDPAVANPALNGVVPASSFGVAAISGSSVGKFESTAAEAAAGREHSKVYKEWAEPGGPGKHDQFGKPEQLLPASGIDGSYRAHFYFPPSYASSAWTNIFQFKLDEVQPFRQDPQWWVSVVPGRAVGAEGNMPYLHVAHWNDPTYKDGSGGGGTAQPLPRGRWFEVRADVRERERIDWFIDGTHWQTSQHSEYKIGRDVARPGARVRAWVFGVGHYGGAGWLLTDDASFTPTKCQGQHVTRPTVGPLESSSRRECR